MPVKTGRTIRPTSGGPFQNSRLAASTGPPGEGRSTLAKFLDVLSTGSYITAGLAEETIRRQKGLKGKPLGRVIKGAVKQRKSWSDLTGHPVTGFVADILFDPITWVPGAAFAKVGTGIKAGARITGMAKAGRVLGEISEVQPHIRRLKDALGSVVSPKYYLKKYNPKRVLAANNEYIRKVDGAAHYTQEELTRQMMRLEPDENMRVKIFNLLERQPVGNVDRGDPSFLQFVREFNELTPQQKYAFRWAGKKLDELEYLKQKAGLLTKERIAGFLQKHGIRYVPRMQARRSEALRELDGILAAKKAGDPAVAAVGSIKEIERSIRFIKELDEVLPANQVEAIKEFFRSSAGVRFLFKRKTVGKVEDLPAEIAQNIEQDMAVVLGRESAEVARAVASTKYITKLSSFMEKQGLVVDAPVAGDPEVLYKMLRRKNTAEEAAKRVREGFRKISGTGTPIDGKYAPASLVTEIKQAYKAYTDPKFLAEYTNLYTTIQNMWKAWTLSIFPSYHSRNVISNVFNNFLAGMHINSKWDYQAAWHMLHKAKAGALNATDEVIGGMTEAQLWKRAMEERVVRGGQFMGELEAGMRRGLYSKNFAYRMINPATNPWVQTGYKTGAFLEDQARLAHFLFKMRKGMSAADAAKSVNKFLFDYKYGLTQFERKWFRDFMFPFWAWTRFNIPLQLEMIVLQPRKFTPMVKAKRAIEDQFGRPEPNEIYMADWMKRAFKVRWRHNKETGDYQYFILDNWWPAADVTKLFNSERAKQELLGLWSPIQKVPIEAFFNYNLFLGKPISEYKGQTKRIRGPAVTTGMLAGSKFGLKGAVAGAAAGALVQKVTGKKEVALPARLEHFLRTARIINETDRVLEALDRDGWISAVFRPAVGRSYPVNYEKQKEYWGYMMNKRIREAKRQRTKAEKAGELDNVRTLDQQIDILEAAKKEYE